MKVMNSKATHSKISILSVVLCVLKFPLIPLGILYFFILKVKNLFYDKNIFSSRKLSKPVISIGNISVGGSGKTALVLSLAEKFDQFAVLTRGYKSKVTQNKTYPQMVKANDTAMYGDEPSLIASYMRSGLVVIDPDRFRGGEYALSQNTNIDFFILDDGFQHRKLHRDLDLVVFDLDTFVDTLVFGKPIFLFMLLPFGKFRESLSALKRADCVLISKWNHLKSNQVDQALRGLKKINSNILFLESEITDVVNTSGERMIKGKVILFSGLGNPTVFAKDISVTFPDLKILKHKVFKDHHKYSIKDVQDLVKLAEENDANLICSEKDFIKIKEFELGKAMHKVFFSRQSLKIEERLSDLIIHVNKVKSKTNKD